LFAYKIRFYDGGGVELTGGGTTNDQQTATKSDSRATYRTFHKIYYFVHNADWRLIDTQYTIVHCIPLVIVCLLTHPYVILPANG